MSKFDSLNILIMIDENKYVAYNTEPWILIIIIFKHSDSNLIRYNTSFCMTKWCFLKHGFLAGWDVGNPAHIPLLISFVIIWLPPPPNYVRNIKMFPHNEEEKSVNFHISNEIQTSCSLFIYRLRCSKWDQKINDKKPIYF